MPRLRIVLFVVLCLGAVACRPKEQPVVAEYAGTPVILISIDTLRADRLPAYGYKAVDTPSIDGFRKDAILFEKAFSHSPLTLPSHISMFTGLLPPDHGVRNNLGYRFDPDRGSALPSIFKASGYSTGAAVSSYVLRGSTGLSQLFDEYEDAIAVVPGRAAGQLQRRGGETVEIALKWIDANGQQPFFYFLHLFEPHTPYEAPEPYRSRYGLSYDAEIAHVDAIVGRFLEALKQRTIYDRAIIILLSDHGEGLGDHGELEHGIFLYREAIHVPLMVKLPQSKDGGSTRPDPVQLVDLFPTLTSLTGMSVPDRVAREGRSLFDAPAAQPREIFSETMYPRIHLGWSELRSIVSGDRHFIQAPSPELYDLAADPRETRNLVAEERRAVARLRAAAERHAKPLEAATAVSEEEAANLRALGYLSSAASPSEGPLPDPKERIADLRVLSDAEGLLRSGKPDGAIALLEGVVARNPRFTDALSQLARTYEESGRLEKAVELRKRIITTSPSLAGEMALALASNYLLMARHEDAEAHARLALSSSPAPAHLLIGRARLGLRDFTGAEQQAREAMRTRSYAIPATVLLAQVRVAQSRDNLPEALALLERADAEIRERRLDPVPLLEFARGDVLARMNRFEEADRAFRREIEFFPHNREAYAALAVTQILRGDPEGAESTFRELVRDNPGQSSNQLAAQTFERFGLHDRAARWR